MRKTARTKNRSSVPADHLFPLGPDGDWYDRYWLSDKPWPDPTFSVGRSPRPLTRIVISITLAGWLHVFNRLSRTLAGFKWLMTRESR